MVHFIDTTHKYYSPDSPDINWTSVTSVVGKLHEEFTGTPEKSSLRKPTASKPNKW